MKNILSVSVCPVRSIFNGRALVSWGFSSFFEDYSQSVHLLLNALDKAVIDNWPFCFFFAKNMIQFQFDVSTYAFQILDGFQLEEIS